MIPLFKPSCTDLEVQYVTDVLRSEWWGLGPKVEELEEKFARRIGASYAVATSSATAALEMTLAALPQRGPVILPALTFVSTGLAALRNNREIIFADVDESTLCMDWTTVPLTGDATIIPVWYGGKVRCLPPGWESQTVEDCAHAVGSFNAGVLGRAACWSFHAVKNMAAGDGGMVTTNDPRLADKLRALRWCGIDRSTWERDTGKGYNWDYNVVAPGYKAHMNDITAALALAQLERLDWLNDRRRYLSNIYLTELENIDWLRLPKWDAYSSWHLFVVRVNDRDRFIDHMLENDVSAGVHYKPLNTYDIFPSQRLPVTDRVWKTLVTLPLYPDMTHWEIGKVIDTVKSFKP